MVLKNNRALKKEKNIIYNIVIYLALIILILILILF